MAVMTRSRAAAQRGLNPTHPNTNAVEARNNIHETAVPGAAGNRKPARGRRAKTNGVQTPRNRIEARDSASTASRRGDDNERHMSQPRTITQTISQACGLYVKLTFEQVATTSNVAGNSSQPLPTSPSEADGAGAKKPRKGRRTTTRRGLKANAKTGRPGQQTKGPGTADAVRAGTKRRREDDEHQPDDSGNGEMDTAPATCTLRRIRRKTEKAAAADALNHDGIDGAVNRTRRNKGKARAVDVPTTEEVPVGSKRRRDEEDTDTDDVSQLPLDPGPSRRTARRTRQKVEEVPTAKETRKKAIRKRRDRRSDVPPRSPITVSRASTPLSCESEEPTFAPSPAPPQRREAEERPASQGISPEVLIKQEEVTPSLSLGQPTAGLPAEDAAFKVEPSESPSPLMLPEPLVQATTPWPFAPPSDVGGSIIKEEETSSPPLDRDISLSPGGSDKENDPTLAWLPRRRCSVPSIEDVPPLCLDSPDAPDDDEHSSSEFELGPSENNVDLHDGNPFAYHYVVRNGPRRPLQPLEIVTTFVPEDVESDEYDTAASDDAEVMYPEDDLPSLSATDDEIDTAQHRASPLACNSNNLNEADANIASTRENLGDPRRCSSSEVEELLGAPSSPCSIAVPQNVDQDATHESLVPPVAEPTTRTGSPRSVASEVHANGRSRSPYDESFIRSRAPSPTPFPPDRTPASYLTPERPVPLPPCQCGDPARHFVVHSDGEASDFSFMCDDEDF